MKVGNKLRRQQMFVENKREATKSRHEERHRRKKEEDKDPELRRQRLEKNQAITIEKKRVWDEDGDEETLGVSVDLAQAKRRRMEREEEEAERQTMLEENGGVEEDSDDADADSMLGSDDDDNEEDEGDEDEEDEERQKRIQERIRKRQERDVSAAPSVAASLAPSTTSTNMDLTPASLARKFPNLSPTSPYLRPRYSSRPRSTRLSTRKPKTLPVFSPTSSTFHDQPIAMATSTRLEKSANLHIIASSRLSWW